MPKQIVEICVSHEKTKDCYKELVSIINDYSTDSEAYFFRYYAPRKIFKLTVFGMCFYLPIMINSYRTISICQEIEKISKKILKSARRKKLTNTMETLYKYAFGDEGKEAALNTYLNMSEKRRKSKKNPSALVFSADGFFYAFFLERIVTAMLFSAAWSPFISSA